MIRAAGGFQPILDACLSEYPEIQELALSCLTKCATDGKWVLIIKPRIFWSNFLHLLNIFA